MQWSDKGFVLSARRHGETSVIVNLLCLEHGRHVGLVRGGNSSRQRGILQPGNLVSAIWRARLEDHLGAYTIEPEFAFAAELMDKPGPLAALVSVCNLIEISLPEREPHPKLYGDLGVLMSLLNGPDWCSAYARWELTLLEEVGFALDLPICTGEQLDINRIYVSPNSGRPVSKSAGGSYRDELLPMPCFLTGDTLATPSDLLDALRLTGHFIYRYILEPNGRSMPDVRTRLVSYLGVRPNCRGGSSN